MRLFMFKSESNGELRAFSSDANGEQLPTRHEPWTAIGVIREDKDPPHNLSRTLIEKGVSDQGFQLYRMKTKQG